MQPIIYFRKSLMESEELSAASKHFKCVDLISNISKNDFVIPRYSMYPYFYDQQREISNIGAKIINNYQQHVYIADLQNYVLDLKELTPLTWDNLQNIPDQGPFVLKGATNSKKFSWSKNMFAKDKQQAIEIYSNLLDDPLISEQKIYIRQYVPLFTYLIGFGGLPITKEFRFFIAYKQIVSGGYYWSNYSEDLTSIPSIDEVPKEFLNKVVNIIGNKSNFYTIDVAQTEAGEWIVIELNDGMQAGLSENNPEIFYSKLREIIDQQLSSNF